MNRTSTIRRMSRIPLFLSVLLALALAAGAGQFAAPNAFASATTTGTTTTLTSTPNPSYVGQGVTFTAKVTSAIGSPTSGRVVFKQGSVVLGTFTLTSTSNGTATFPNITSLPLGYTYVKASFEGSPGFYGSTTYYRQQVIGIGTTTALAPLPSCSISAGTCILKATVTPASGIKVPTGSVAFKQAVAGALNLQTVTLVAGTTSATATTTNITSLAPGTYHLVAKYGGDATFAGSTSPSIAVQIQP